MATARRMSPPSFSQSDPSASAAVRPVPGNGRASHRRPMIEIMSPSRATNPARKPDGMPRRGGAVRAVTIRASTSPDSEIGESSVARVIAGSSCVTCRSSPPTGHWTAHMMNRHSQGNQTGDQPHDLAFLRTSASAVARLRLLRGSRIGRSLVGFARSPPDARVSEGHLTSRTGSPSTQPSAAAGRVSATTAFGSPTCWTCWRRAPRWKISSRTTNFWSRATSPPACDTPPSGWIIRS